MFAQHCQRTKSSWQAARRDSRLGFEWEQDYNYTPELLDEKSKLLDCTLHRELPEYRQRHGL